ncbi:MAG: recombinase family protein [Acidobacteriota bacterium]|nr:recombinase family protein [Acidobacteriota bacterium]
MSITARERTTTPAIAQRQAVLYARVSSKDQEREGYSIPAQERLLREYATTHQLLILEEFVDVETAKTTGRHGFTSMLAYLKRHPACRTVLVEKTDRLYRNLKDWVTIDEHDLEIHFVKENLVHSQDSRSSEKFLHGIKVLMAKNYIDNLGEEASKGMQEKARAGLWPSYAPLGYQNTLRPDGKRVITPDPLIGPIVTKLFDLFATGSYSLRTLAQKAQEDGLSYRKSGQRMPPNTLQKLLRKRIYTGDFDFNGTTYHGSHDPLTTKDTWERVQEVLDGRNQQPRRTTHAFPYNGLVRCGHCGCSLIGEEKRKPSGKTYTYYHCTGYRGRCPEPYTPAAKLEAQFLAVLRSLVIPPEVANWLTETLRDGILEDERERTATLRRLAADVERLQVRIDAMYVDKLDGTIATVFFEEKAREWRAEQARLQRKITCLEQEGAVSASDTLSVLDLAQRAATLFPKQTPTERREILTLVIRQAAWKGRQLTVDFQPPFAALRRVISSTKLKQPEIGT